MGDKKTKNITETKVGKREVYKENKKNQKRSYEKDTDKNVFREKSEFRPEKSGVRRRVAWGCLNPRGQSLVLIISNVGIVTRRTKHELITKLIT